MKKFLNLSFVVLLAMTARAADTTYTLPDPYNTTVTPGIWCGNFHSATNYAVRNDLPLVLVWGMEECDHCNALLEALIGEDADAAIAWAATKSVVFCVTKADEDGYDKEPNVGAFEFAWQASGLQSPVVRLYHKNESAPLCFKGQLNAMYSKEGTTLFEQFKNSVETFVSDLPPPAPSGEKSYAAFPMGDTAHDRLEVLHADVENDEAETTVTIPLVRTNNVNQTANNKIAYVYDGEIIDEVEVAWKSGESMKLVESIRLHGMYKNDKLGLILQEANGVEIARRNIWVVEDPGNTPVNPYWIGERTADDFQWGDWSMDIDAVTNRVRSYNATHPTAKAYAMVLVEGSRWCKDCAMTEAYFLNNDKFKKWASDSRVLFGVVDIPRNPQASDPYPSLLRYESSRTSDTFCSLGNTGPTNETLRYQSGAGYLSRHHIAYTGTDGRSACEVAARNAALLGHDTLNGGWNRPESSNKTRTGVPIFLLLRDDGTIAARWTQFATKGPEFYSDGYLERFNEMLAQINEPNEESDDDKSTTTRQIAVGATAPQATVSTVDRADVYRVTGLNGRRLEFTISGSSSARLKLSVIDDGTVVATEAGSVSDGISLKYLPTSADCYVKVAPDGGYNSGFFASTSGSSTLCAYNLSVTTVLDGGEIGFVLSTTNVMENCGTVNIPLIRQNGAVGVASVKVELIPESAAGSSGRITWTDTVVTWDDTKSGIKTVPLVIKDDGVRNSDLTLRFRLTNLMGTGEGLTYGITTLRVNIYDDEVTGKRIYRYVKVDDQHAVAGYQAGDEVVLALQSGALPTGVEASPNGGSVEVSGVCRAAAGDYTAVYTVTLRRSGTDVSTTSLPLAYAVMDYDFSSDIPSLAETRTYGNVPVFDEEGQLKGVLTVTVPANGRISAKYVTAGKTISFSADGWTSYDSVATVLRAVVDDVIGLEQPLNVTIDPSGGRATMADPLDPEEELSFNLPVSDWPTGAVAYRGQYTVQMPQTNVVDGLSSGRMGGSAFMALRMVDAASVNAGVMCYAGVLPNGRAVYGSSVLSAGAGEKALLPFFHRSELKSAPYEFSGCLAITKNAEENHEKDLWSVTTGSKVTFSDPSASGRTAELAVFGGYYDTNTIYQAFQDDYVGLTSAFSIWIDTMPMPVGRYGHPVGIAAVSVAMDVDGRVAIKAGETNPRQITLEFSLETGVVRGRFVLPFEGEGGTAVVYQGIALPGWQGDCSSCALKNFAQRPWADGSCSFSDRVGKTSVFRNGCRVELATH